MSQIELVSKGTISSCWKGNYHYLEPWMGCEHDCGYCYAKVRPLVKDSLAEHQGVFKNPLLNGPDFDTLKSQMIHEIHSQKVEALKLCRYTDFFTPSMVDLSYPFYLLKAICEETSVSRIIITTKGIPDEKTISLMAAYRERFSFNLSILPEAEKTLMISRHSNEEKMAVAQRINELGVQTTIHFDPIALSLFSPTEDWHFFLQQLLSYKLKRVMFSYLLLEKGVEENLKEKLEPQKLEQLLSLFDMPKDVNYNYLQSSLAYLNKNVIQEHVDMLSALLKFYKFDFVLCSLKALKNGTKTGSDCPACTGDFYA